MHQAIKKINKIYEKHSLPCQASNNEKLYLNMQ